MKSLSERARRAKSPTMSCPHCGVEIEEPKAGKPRSVPQHRRYWALVRAAYNHWPSKHRFTPMSEDHLRKWLQVQAGHRIVETLDMDGMALDVALASVAAQITKSGPMAFHESVGTRFYSIVSASIDFDSLPHLAACALFDAVAEVIEAETGLRCDDMITHTQRTRQHENVPEAM